MVRGHFAIGFFAIALFLLGAGIANAWAAWAPPGEHGLNYDYLRWKSSSFYGGAILSFVTGIVLVWSLLSSRDNSE